MAYLLVTLWPWMLAALLLGLAVGWLTSRFPAPAGPEPSARFSFGFWVVVAAIVVAVFAAITHFFKGKAGFWFDAALLMTAFYFIGCCLGCIAHTAFYKQDHTVFVKAMGSIGPRIHRPVRYGDEAGAPTASTPVARLASAMPAAATTAAAKPATGAGASGMALAPSPPAKAVAVAASSAAVVPSAAAVQSGPTGRRPIGLVAPRGGRPDDLARLPAMTPERIARLHGIGIYHYDQICTLKAEERDWVFDYLGLASTLGMGARSADYAGWGNACALASLPPATATAPAAAQTAAVAPPAAPVALVGATSLGTRPKGLVGPRAGGPDDLTALTPIDSVRAAKLHGAGLYHYDQMAGLDRDGRTWVWNYTDLKSAGVTDAEGWDGWAKAQVLGAAPPATEMEKVEGEDAIAGSRPYGLRGPRDGKPDNLKLVRGIGPQNEGRLHALGIWHFDQIAGWTHDNALWIGSYLAFPGRIERENWIDQAKQLAAGAMTEFAKRAASGLVPTSKDDGSLGQGNVARLAGDDFSEGPSVGDRAGKAGDKPS